jgi:hypothetical protein
MAQRRGTRDGQHHRRPAQQPGELPAALRDLRDRHPGRTATLSELEPHEALPALLEQRAEPV